MVNILNPIRNNSLHITLHICLLKLINNNLKDIPNKIIITEAETPIIIKTKDNKNLIIKIIDIRVETKERIIKIRIISNWNNQN